MDKRRCFGMIGQFLLSFGFEADCAALTLLGVEPHTLLDLGLVVVNESGDVVFDHDDAMVGGLRDEMPDEKLEPQPPIPEVEAGDARCQRCVLKSQWTLSQIMMTWW